MLLQKYGNRNGRCIAILSKSIGVGRRFNSPEFGQRFYLLTYDPARPLTGVSRALRARNPKKSPRVSRALPAPGSKKCPKQSQNNLRSLERDCFEAPDWRLSRRLFGVPGPKGLGDSCKGRAGSQLLTLSKACPLQPLSVLYKGQNEKFMNFAHFCEFCCFSLGKQARFTSRTFVPECPLEKFMNWPFFGLVCRGHS